MFVTFTLFCFSFFVKNFKAPCHFAPTSAYCQDFVSLYFRQEVKIILNFGKEHKHRSLSHIFVYLFIFNRLSYFIELISTECSHFSKAIHTHTHTHTHSSGCAKGTVSISLFNLYIYVLGKGLQLSLFYRWENWA